MVSREPRDPSPSSEARNKLDWESITSMINLARERLITAFGPFFWGRYTAGPQRGDA